MIIYTLITLYKWLFQEDDPEKQRRWEEKENKRQMKKKAPKMKQLKVKAI